MSLKPKKRKDRELVPMTSGAMKKASDKAVLKLAKEVTFRDCPRCKMRTLGKLGDHEVCINCDYTPNK